LLGSKIAQELNDKGFGVNFTVYIQGLDNDRENKQNKKSHCCTENATENTVSGAQESNTVSKLIQKPSQNAEKDNSKNEGYDVTDDIGNNTGNRLRNGSYFFSYSTFFGLQKFGQSFYYVSSQIIHPIVDRLENKFILNKVAGKGGYKICDNDGKQKLSRVDKALDKASSYAYYNENSSENCK
jgi:hypothetical protein